MIDDKERSMEITYIKESVYWSDDRTVIHFWDNQKQQYHAYWNDDNKLEVYVVAHLPKTVFPDKDSDLYKFASYWLNFESIFDGNR